MNKRKVIRYSESFKLQIVEEYEKSYLTLTELKTKYGITGGQTVQLWIKKYGRSDSLNKIIRVETPKERDKLKSLKEENKQLKAALANQTLKAMISESTVEAVAELLGVSVEELKKKFEGKP